jgi:RNA polymerase sigma factor (sigma-70 family)
MRKNYPYLRNEEMQDLYHTGILGFHKGICAIKPTLESFFIVLVLKMHIKSELSLFYSYKDKEKGCDVLPDVPITEETEKELELKLLFDFIEKSKDLNEKEKKLLNLRYREGKTVREISGILGRLEVTIYKRLSRVVKRLKVLLMDSMI